MLGLITDHVLASVAKRVRYRPDFQLRALTSLSKSFSGR